MSKARTSTQETIEFTLEPKEAGEGKKRKERVKKTMARVIGRSSMIRDPAEDDEEEEEDAAAAPKSQKLMGDAIKSGAAPSKLKTTPKASAPTPNTASKRSTRNIPAAEKNKAPVPKTEVEDEEDVEAQVLRQLKPKIPDHDDNHPVAENMKIRKDASLKLWRESDPYALRRRTAVDYRFHTKEQQDFYETILLDKKPIVCDIKWADWNYIDNNEDHFPGVHESFRLCGVDKFVGQKLTKWNDELIMQFYSTTHFYPDGRIVWMSEVPTGKLLGFLVSERGIEANSEKVEAITSLSKPTWINDIQRLAGRIAALSQFISSNAANEAFGALKKQLAEPPILATPIDKEPLLLYVVANNKAVSVAVVVERKEAGKQYIVQRTVYYVTEYEALLHGLCMAKEMNLSRVRCLGDLDLIAQQVSGKWDSKDPLMAAYRQAVTNIAGHFKGYQVDHIGWRHNEAADALFRLGSQCKTVLPNVFLDVLHNPSVKLPSEEDLAIPDPEGQLVPSTCYSRLYDALSGLPNSGWTARR
ncbi:uncharacterized protein [Aegilops tauschii subsp. strangulata]|uniref:uncharacterized protein n=1 Tax=Aegilops tauschii subsp. strangulata TaxID=200361 RepID=UPI003CC8C5AD